MYTNLITQAEASQEAWELAEWQRHLDDLAWDPNRFYPALFQAALIACKDRRGWDLFCWEGQRVELGGGAWLELAADDNIHLFIERDGLTGDLGLFASWERDIDGWQIGTLQSSYAHQVRAFERTHRTRGRALEAAYQAAREALGDVVNGRLDRAYNLAISGAVTLNGNGAIVRSQSNEGESYAVNGRCNCPDAEHRAPAVNGRPACKHQLAVWLTRKATGQEA